MQTRVPSPSQPVQKKAHSPTSRLSARNPLAAPPLHAQAPQDTVSKESPDAPAFPGFDLGKITIHEAAAQGLAGGAQRLPHLDRIQKSFGPHDIGSIQAHVGGPAVQAAQRLGAMAYAVGNSVAFRESPDLHTAAHEAAHVVQQRWGVHLASKVGQEGDPYERHADAVADAVVGGRSAHELLNQFASSRRESATQGARPMSLQRKEEEESLPEGEAAAVPEGPLEKRPDEQGAVQRKAYKGRGGIGIMGPADMPYFYEMGTSTTEDVEAKVSWEPNGIPKISVESRDLKIGTTGPGDVVSLTPVYMESQSYGRPYPSKKK